MVMLGIGEYPLEYNAKVHVPYDPARFYGKPDTAFTQVKLGEMLPWMKRRNYNPVAMTRAVGRGVWRWSQTWMMPKKAGAAGLIQLMMVTSLWYWLNQRPHLKYHSHCKYH